jgi:hypothetical protein
MPDIDPDIHPDVSHGSSDDSGGTSSSDDDSNADDDSSSNYTSPKKDIKLLCDVTKVGIGVGVLAWHSSLYSESNG